MHSCNTCRESGCPMTLNRRGFLAGMAATAAATEMGLFDFASSLCAAEAAATGKPVVNVVFIRPGGSGVVVSWPGGNCGCSAAHSRHCSRKPSRNRAPARSPARGAGEADEQAGGSQPVPGKGVAESASLTA